MATRRRRRSSKKPARRHARRRARKFTRVHGYVRRRRNPGMPAIVSSAIGIGVGAAAGVGLAYGADKLGVLSPTARNWALLGVGLVGGGLLASKAPAAGLAVGGGVAAVGLARALVTTLYAQPPATAAAATTAPVSGLGMGDGDDMAGAYDRLGGRSVYDGVGEVIDNYGMGYVTDD